MGDERRVGDEQPRWVQIDSWGKTLRGRQGEMDLEIGEWLLLAREENVHRRLGCASLLEYAERRLGFDGHTIRERLRVAEVLVGLPGVREALRSGEHSLASVRELTRVVVPGTEGEWLEASRGLRKRQVEQLVSGRRPGQGPRDPVDARLQRHVLRFEVPGEVFALWQEAVRVMRRDVDGDLGEDQILAEMSRRVLGGPADEGRSPYQVALNRCEDCDRVFQQARGEQIEVTPEVLERAACDGQHIGRVDGEAATSPGGHVSHRLPRATQTVAPVVRRMVLRRDRGRCKVPGCRNTNWLEVHHLRMREEKGSHDPENLACLCGAHHTRIHDGFLVAEGGASNVRFLHVDGTPYGDVPDAAEVSRLSLAFGALRKMGFRETEAKAAIERVRGEIGEGASLEEVIRQALIATTETGRASGVEPTSTFAGQA